MRINIFKFSFVWKVLPCQ